MIATLEGDTSETGLSNIYDGYLGGKLAKQGYQIFIMFAIHRQPRHVKDTRLPDI